MPLKDRTAFLIYQDRYQRTTGREKRALRFKWLGELKARPCEDCGHPFPPECMDFDHRNPRTKKFSISQAVVSGYSVESVLAEIKKCRLICANCHRIRTARQQRRGQR